MVTCENGQVPSTPQPAVAAAYLREEIEPAFASAATGLYIGGTAAGGMAGRLVSGALSDVGDWRAALGGIGTLAVLCAAAAWALLPASRHWQRVPLRPRELNASARRMFLDRELFTLYTLGLLGMGAFVSVFNGLAFRLAAPPFSLSVGLAGLIHLTNGLGSVSSPIAGRLAGRFGPRAVVIGALLVTLAGVGVTLLDALVAVVAGAALVTTGFFAAHGTLSGWVSGRASTRGPGTGMAGSLYLSAYYMGSSVCGALTGSAWSLGSWPGVAAFVAALLVAGLLGAASLRHAPRPDAGVLPPLEA